MKRITSLLFLLLTQVICFSQGTKISPPQVNCNGSADQVAGIYTDHTKGKYGPPNLKGTTAEKAAMMKNLVSIEKLEEASRKNFQLNGCAARASFARHGNSEYGKNSYASYWYQLGVYQYVCHVTEHKPKIVDEYRTVLRVEVNPYIATGAKAGGTGDFSINNQGGYEIPIQAKAGPSFENDKKNKPSKVSQYISENMMLANRSSDYKNKHADFLKIINGDGFSENWMNGSKYDKWGPDSYQWIDRHYIITKPGVPLLIPVSRRQYLEDMLEYLEIEKANFEYDNARQVKNYATDGDKDYAVKARAALAADRQAYPKYYEARKTKIKDLLANQKPEWLQKAAVVDNNNTTYDANKRLESMGKFYDEEGEYSSALYVLNPEYFKTDNAVSTKPRFMEIQFRYELSKDRGFSERLFNNFLKNFDFDALRKML